jgi:hypothetical protein
MIKKIIFLLSVALLVGVNSNAQSQKGDFEFSLGYGALSAPKIRNEANDLFRGVATLGTQYETNKSSYGPLSLTGSYAVSNRFKLGLAFTLERDKSELWEKSLNGNNQTKQGDINVDSYGVMASGSFSYVNKKHLQLYSGLALGLGLRREGFEKESISSISEESSSSTRFAYQITGFGIRLGGKLAGFAEVGFGYKGIVSTGIAYRF